LAVLKLSMGCERGRACQRGVPKGVIGRASPTQPSKKGRDAQPYGTRTGRAVSTIALLPARGGSPAARGVSVGHAPALPATFHVASARTPAVAANEDMQDTLPPRRARELRAGRAPWLSWGRSSVHASWLRQAAAHVAARRLMSSVLGRASGLRELRAGERNGGGGGQGHAADGHRPGCSRPGARRGASAGGSARAWHRVRGQLGVCLCRPSPPGVDGRGRYVIIWASLSWVRSCPRRVWSTSAALTVAWRAVERAAPGEPIASEPVIFMSWAPGPAPSPRERQLVEYSRRRCH